MNFFFFRNRNPETKPPTEFELCEDRNESLSMVLGECGLDKIDLKTKWLDNKKGLHLFVRLFRCSSENWTAFHKRSDKIKKKLSRRGIQVNEIFYSHNSDSQTGLKKN